MNLRKRVAGWFHQIAESQNPDRYCDVRPKPTVPSTATQAEVVIPEYLRGEDVPNLGPKHEHLLHRAVELWPDEINRKKWLQAIGTLLKTETGWVMMDGKAKFGQAAAPSYTSTVAGASIA